MLWKDGNRRALLLGLAVTVLVVGSCLLAYPPGSTIYDAVNGRRLAIAGRRAVPVSATIRPIFLTVAGLSTLPAVLFLVLRRRQLRSSQPVRRALLLYLVWGILLVGWLLLSDWYPLATVD